MNLDTIIHSYIDSVGYVHDRLGQSKWVALMAILRGSSVPKFSSMRIEHV